MTKRTIEIYSAGCPACDQAVALVHEIACPSCGVEVHDMRDAQVADRAKALGIASVPAVVIDGEVAHCCAGRGIDIEALRSAGLGQQ